jgi:hypothetical protein
MPRTPRNPTTGRFRRRYDPLRTEAAFDDAFGDSDQDLLGREEDEELNPSDDASLPTDPAIFTDHDNHDGMAHLRDDESNDQVAATTETPGQRLAHLRQNFNPENVLRSSKAPATFNKHKSNQERFILFLYENNPELLHQELIEALDDVDAEIDYSTVVSSHRRFQRNGGTKTIEERKAERRIKVLRDEIAEFLGPPGLRAPRPTVKLLELESRMDVFLKFVTSIRKRGTDKLLKSGAYCSFRSSLTYLFRRYRHIPGQAFENDLTDAMEGIKRYVNEAIQAGEGNINEGDRPLSWGLYEQFNRWFIAEGTEDGIFACAFSKLTCNLACRGNSTSKICTKHIKWGDDSLEIAFAHAKEFHR